jgi:predicted nucleic acid-binding protein
MSGPTSAGWIVDASVAVKWFLPVESEPDVALARQAIGRLPMLLTTLTIYETGNVLTRASGFPPHLVAQGLGRLLDICGPAEDLDPEDFVVSARLVEAHGITFYDASYSAIAQRLNRGVISADRDLLEPGLAVSLGDAIVRSG